MNKVEQIVHKLVGDYPFLRVPLVLLYQRICSIVPTSNFEVSRLDACHPGYFFGFHDKCPWSHDNLKLLAHRFDVNKSAALLEKLPIEVGYFESGEYHLIGNTSAWNWQQGATLQWVGKTNKVVYNDIEQQQCIARIIDLDTGRRDQVQWHIMAISNNGKYAISCSYSRLGKGMSGYGYNQSPGNSDLELLPDNEGIMLIDLESKTVKQLITLADIVKITPNRLMDGAYHFFSHCLFSPDDRRFVFFHRFLRKNGSLETRMFSANLNGENIWQFSGDKFSHIAWSANTKVIAYCNPPNQKIGFYFLEEFSSKVTGIENKCITSDGHPHVSYDGKYVLIDTYPDRFRNQRLLLYDIERNHSELLVKYKIPFKYRLERRCDFHPRWNRDNTIICYDSAHSGVRSLCIMRNPLIAQS